MAILALIVGFIAVECGVYGLFRPLDRLLSATLGWIHPPLARIFDPESFIVRLASVGLVLGVCGLVLWLRTPVR
ncbi:MAG: hypothetical protein IT428_27990 [Planctomycetaceae bacterium]|nr:hypothetical protein [Planctomycetaceae bacterium]